MYIPVVATLLTLVGFVIGLPLTVPLEAQDRACFYVSIEKPRTSISFYFAVQSGGAFDIDYAIKDPHGAVKEEKHKQRGGELVLGADLVGEYEFCFSNGMSTFAQKVIDFEIKVENDDAARKATMPQHVNNMPATHVKNMQDTVNDIELQLDTLIRSLQYYKTRNNRNQATVKSTEARIYYFSVFEVLLMVGMAFLQISVVQLFFKGSRKQLV